MSTTPEQVLSRITSLQASDGLFPSKRVNPAWGYNRLDINVFFTAITVFTLQKLEPLLSAEGRMVSRLIVQKATPAYERFRNKDGLKTYNFYQTKPSQHFPNGYLFSYLKHFQLPDDVDDTAMVYLTTNPTPNELHWLKNKLPQHANLSQRGQTRLVAKSTFSDYRNLTAYSTWFGKNMPIELDACVLCNLLYCIYEYDLPRNQHDADSLLLLRSMVATDRYRTDPFRCAHNYARTSLIIYHLARFIAAFDPPELQSIKEKLIADAQLELARVTNRLDKLLLATSLLRLGHTPAPVDLTAIGTDFGGFHFFIAGMLSAYPWLYRWANRPFWHIRWECEAHNWALVLEYMVLASR